MTIVAILNRGLVLAGAVWALSMPAISGEIKVWHRGGRGDGERGKIAAMLEEWSKSHRDKSLTART